MSVPGSSTSTRDVTASRCSTAPRGAWNRPWPFLSAVRRWRVREQNPEPERLGGAGGGPGVRRTEPVTVAVVDDEPLAREGLLMLLEQDPEVKVVGEAGSGAHAPALLAPTPPQLLFLDVQMPGGSGFEGPAPPAPPPPLGRFCTASHPYAPHSLPVPPL